MQGKIVWYDFAQPEPIPEAGGGDPEEPVPDPAQLPAPARPNRKARRAHLQARHEVEPEADGNPEEPEEPVLEADGNPEEPVLEADGNPEEPVLEADGNPEGPEEPVLEADGNPEGPEEPVLEADGNPEEPVLEDYDETVSTIFYNWYLLK
jgi:hypothetical protein